MMQITISVMAIALAALFVAGGATYLSSDLGVRTQTKHMVLTGFGALDAAQLSYSIANSLPPSAPAACTGECPPPCEGANQEEWCEELLPYLHNGMPAAPSGMHWRYGRSEAGTWFCLVGDVTEAVYKGLRDIHDQKRRIDSRSAHLAVPTAAQASSALCGSESGTLPATATSAALTYWLSRND